MLTKLTLEESASTVLKGRILNGELPPGMRLIEAAWSTELGVSRPTIRSAFQRLTELGLASRSNYVGWSVAALSHQDLREVAQVRAALEGFAAFLIAGNSKRYLQSETHNELTDCLDWLAHSIDSGTRSQIDAADQAFHATLVKTCGNSRIAAQHQSISDQMTLAIRTANLTGEPHTQLYQQHLELYQQLKQGDAPAAEAAVRSHCLAVLNRLPHLQNPSQEAV